MTPHDILNMSHDTLRAHYERAINDVETLRGRLTELTKAHHADINLISDALLEKAAEHDWCSEFDEFIEQLNRSLNIELQPRTAEYTADITVTLRFDCAPQDSDSMSDEIAMAIMRYGDNLGGQTYVIDNTSVNDVQSS